jgi:hypothetical protein
MYKNYSVLINSLYVEVYMQTDRLESSHGSVTYSNLVEISTFCALLWNHGRMQTRVMDQRRRNEWIADRERVNVCHESVNSHADLLRGSAMVLGAWAGHLV